MEMASCERSPLMRALADVPSGSSGFSLKTAGSRANESSLEASSACCICGAVLAGRHGPYRDRLHGTPGLFFVDRCLSCGHLQTMGPIGAAALTVAYPANYVVRSFSKGITWRERLLSHFVRKIEENRVDLLCRRIPEISKAWTVFDAGCGNGGFLVALKKKVGCGCYGIEMDEECVRQARMYSGSDVTCGEIGSSPIPGGPYDLLTLWHVLEHLPRPLEILGGMRQRVRPGGYLAIAVPDASGMAARLFGNYWFGCDVPRHRHHFTRQSLCRLLYRAGWNPLHACHVTEVSTVAGSLHNLLGRRWCDDLPGNLFRWVALQAVFLSMDHLLRVFGQSDWLVVIARTPHDLRGPRAGLVPLLVPGPDHQPHADGDPARAPIGPQAQSRAAELHSAQRAGPARSAWARDPWRGSASARRDR